MTPGRALIGILGVVGCATFGALRASAQWVGPEFQVNGQTTDSQGLPKISADGSGRFVVVWQGEAQDGSGSGVFARRFDAAGDALGPEFRVNSATTSDQDYAAVSLDGAGGFAVVWQSGPPGPVSQTIRARRFDSSGQPVGNEFEVGSHHGGLDLAPEVVSDREGNFVVVWQAYGEDGYGVFGQRFDATGAPRGDEFLVNSYTTGNQRNPSIAGGADGGFVVAWQSSGQDGFFDWIFARRFAADGDPIGSDLQVSAYSSADLRRPSVARLSSGDFVVVWESPVQDDSNHGVIARRFDATGAPLSGETLVNTFTTGFQGSPVASSRDSGSWMVAWESVEQDGSGSGIYARAYDSSGTALGSEFRVNSFTTDSQAGPAIAPTGAGQFAVVWSSYSQDGSDWGVFAQRLAGAVFANGFESGDLGRWSSSIGSLDPSKGFESTLVSKPSE